ncbi:MAG: hypothetical protein JWN01_860 [Patescibacteria group bacterium]|nr:hypothetical protein [Patescibacteria group bacterium]
MISAKDIFVKCDELDGLPEPNRENYLRELELLQAELPRGSRVLQVGSMDGMRIIRLLQIRPDLQLTGLEIVPELVDAARGNISGAHLEAGIVCGDITDPPRLGRFDYVICLNHTLGYIPDQEKALAEMRKLGEKVVVSVYGEKFDDELARAQVDAWGGKVAETPTGYFCVLPKVE